MRRATARRLLVALAAASVVACSGAAPAAPVAAGAAPPPAQRVVVLDPGHNGGNYAGRADIRRPVPDGRGGTKPCNTVGTETDAGYPEHAFTFDVAQRVETRLVAAGVRVVLTRPDDAGVGPCVDARAAAADAAGADAFVSVHADGSGPADHGFHVAYAEPPPDPAQAGPTRALATSLRDALRGAGFATSSYTGTDGLSGRPDLAGLNLSHRPSVLVECANMRNAAEAATVTSPEGRDRYAAAIAAGVLAFLAH
ncbi:N-acetylmuramoyl-L-alanine amidase [Pseudonocardia sp. CA-107938]|uniref:N-acetylmuramoyl-L-alanine amidase n=1 Tax=Pseudonocardia sp. CA-107938 TaxID=3240021 RepID=UPI003D94B6D0